MKTLKEVKDVALMQYMLECLYETYTNASKESEKYFIKLEFLKLLEDKTVDFELAKKYMLLNKDKFKPFFALIKDMAKPRRQSKKYQTCFSSPQEEPVHVVAVYHVIGD